MSNSYFRFKQFTIHQEHCAMKVSTDACIQGAWTPVNDNVKQVLDIGTGTGLLSLMLAQRNPGIYIDAIELDIAAAQQAKDNITASPWSDMINILQGDVREYAFRKKYDLIICNPPFFQNSLLSNVEERNNARHNTSLSFNDIAFTLDKYLNADGYACIMLPVTEHALWQKTLQAKDWTIFQQLNIHPTLNKPANRIISLCTRSINTGFDQSSLCIYEDKNIYTPDFTSLLHSFYLNI